MDSWLPLLLLAVAGFLIGGVVSFARAGRTPLAGALGVGAFLCLIGTFIWWQPA